MHIKQLFRNVLERSNGNLNHSARNTAKLQTHPSEESGHPSSRSSGKAQKPESSIKRGGRGGKIAGAENASPVSYATTTDFLRRCVDHLTPDPRECITYLSGIKIGSVVVLDMLVPFQMQERSVGYVSGNLVSSTAALLMLSDRGYELRGTAHSHPGCGPFATAPSGIDYAHHRRLERGGYEALGIICTRDGYIRFYSDELAFKVEVFGKDGQWVDRNRIFKLDLDFKGESESDEASEDNDNELSPHENEQPQHTGS